MPSFIFDISNTDLSGSIAFPVRNAGSSFIGVVTNISDNGTYTTMTYTWTSYTNLDPNDGLSFNPYYLSYGSTTSINIRQFDGIALPNMTTIYNASFYNFNGTITATDVPIIPNHSLAYCFSTSDCINFGNIGNWDVSIVNDMTSLFNNTTYFNEPIGNWNTSNVTNMSNMFSYVFNFNQPIGNWNVSNVTNMSQMFYTATKFNQPIGNWDTTNVTDMSQLFYTATNFNQPLNNWITTNVTNMSQMFYTAINFNQPIGNWNTTIVTNMNQMFYTATSFNQPIDNWNTSLVTNMYQMFYSATNFNQVSISNWNFSSILTITDFIANTLYTLNQCFTFLTNLSTNPTTNNKSFGLIPAIRESDYQTLIPIFISKSITFSNTNLYNLILSKSYLTSYTFTISYNYNIIFNGQLVQDYYNIKYLEDVTNPGTSMLIFDYLYNTDYDIDTSNNTFSSNGTNISKIPYFNTLYPSIIEYLIYNNSLAYYDDLHVNNITNSYVSNLSRTIISDALFNRFKYTVGQLNSAGYNITELITAGYNITELTSVGYSLSDFINSPFTKSDYTAAGYSVHDLQSAGFTTAMLLSIGYYDFEVCDDINILNSFFKTTYQRQGINNKNKCSPPIYPLSKQNPGIPNSMRYSQRVNSSNKSTYTYSELVANFGTTIQTTPTNAYRKTSGLGGPTFSY